MMKTVKLGSLDALLGLTFGANAFVNETATAVNGSITNSATSPNQVLTYNGMTGTVGSAFLTMNTVSFQVAGISDTDNTLTLDAFVGKTLVGTMDFTVCGFSAAGISLVAMPLAALVSQSGDLPGLDGSLFVLGLNASGAKSQTVAFGISNSYHFIPGAQVHYATTASPILKGGTGTQMLIGLSGNDTITAGNGTTIIHGGPGNDVLIAGSGADTIFGGAGKDTIYGGSGNDTLHAGSGTDTLYAGTGHAVMIAGGGTDSFVFSPGHTGGLTAATADVIQQFHPAVGDKIDLSAFDAGLPTGGTGHLTFIGTAAFGDHPGEVRYDVTNTGITVWGDVNGDGTADFCITLTKLASLTASAFIL